MKKKQQLLSIFGLWVATIVILVVIFAKYYQVGNTNLFTYIVQVEHGTEAEDTRNHTDELEKNTGLLSSEMDSIESVLTEIDSTEIYLTEIMEIPARLEFLPGDKSYFDDALFIGDSRCVGIAEYGNLDNATFFVREGMAVRNVWEKESTVKDVGKMFLQDLLEANSYAKIYVMLGFNELGYDHDETAAKYKETLDKLHEMEPQAIIYVCSNLHVTAEETAKNPTFGNSNIDMFNEKIRAFTDHETFFYLDVNEKFNDEAGNLMDEYTSDRVHLRAKYYQEWSDWFAQKTIQKNDSNSHSESE